MVLCTTVHLCLVGDEAVMRQCCVLGGEVVLYKQNCGGAVQAVLCRWCCASGAVSVCVVLRSVVLGDAHGHALPDIHPSDHEALGLEVLERLGCLALRVELHRHLGPIALNECDGDVGGGQGGLDRN
jgi:hypothetical protein